MEKAFHFTIRVTFNLHVSSVLLAKQLNSWRNGLYSDKLEGVRKMCDC